MAEAAGLALGSVALAGLFSTCVEMLDYFEEGKHWARNLRLALTKVNLMKRRLNQWGDAMAVDTAGAEVCALRERWPQESGVIIESLLGIRGILVRTTQLCQKYRWGGPDKTSWGCDAGPTLSAPTPPTSFADRSVPLRHRTIDTFRSQVIWAIHDRKRFDILIADFDFLLSSLEKIGERLQDETQLRATDGGEGEYKQSRIDLPNLSSLAISRAATIMSKQYRTSGSNGALSPPDSPSLCVSPSGSTIPESETVKAGNTGNATREQHIFINNESSDDAMFFGGNWNSGNQAMPPGPSHRFEGNAARNNSVMIVGNIDATTALNMYREKLARRAEERAKEHGAGLSRHKGKHST